MSLNEPSSEYLLLFRGCGWDHDLSPDELQQAMASFLGWFERLSAEGTLKAGQPLTPEARIVSGRKGRSVADGPFPESKEAVGGYFLVRAASFDEAVAIAQQCPTLEYGAIVEVRAIATDCPTLHRVRQRTGGEIAPVEASASSHA